MDPTVEAATAILEKLRSDLREGLAGQSAAALNWKPASGANSIAGLLAHMMESGNFLVQSGLGRTIPRDREAQFAATAPDAETLLQRVDQGFEPILRGAREYTPEALAARRDFRGTEVPSAWFLLHTCDHLLEHWGQIQLTRDMYQTMRG